MLGVGLTWHHSGQPCPVLSHVVVRSTSRRSKRPDDFVLTRSDGSPIKDFRGAWANLCKRARLEGLILHDLRRSAAKAARRAGVPESVVMSMGGWKTADMLRRYAIVSSADQRDAVRMLERSRTEQASSSATLSAPVLPASSKEGKAKVQ
jgi:integrase